MMKAIIAGITLMVAAGGASASALTEMTGSQNPLAAVTIGLTYLAVTDKYDARKFETVKVKHNDGSNYTFNVNRLEYENSENALVRVGQ